MTVQPFFTFGRVRHESEPVDADTADGQQEHNGEKADAAPAEVNGRSVSSLDAEEKTFGVAKVEAVTSVWTKNSLIALYVLYVSTRPFSLTRQHLPRVLHQFDAATNHWSVSPLCHQRI
jgi:hypothetical protein